MLLFCNGLFFCEKKHEKKHNFLRPSDSAGKEYLRAILRKGM